jgi:lysylphosphatidylglycerol synthetase-like protein (DUF2156 family)
MNKEITKKEIRTFGIGLAVILAVIGSLLFYKHGHPKYLWLYGVSGILLLMALAAPNLLAPIYRGWSKVAHVIGWFNTRLLLALIYYTMFTPIGLLSKLFRKDLLDCKWEPQATTYWIERETNQQSRQNYERQF